MNSVDKLGHNFHASKFNDYYLITSFSTNTEHRYTNPEYPSYYATTHQGFGSQDLPLYPLLNPGPQYTYSNTTHQNHTSSSSRHKKKLPIKNREKRSFSKTSDTTTTSPSTAYTPTLTQTSRKSSPSTTDNNKSSSTPSTATIGTRYSHRHKSRHSASRNNRVKEATCTRQRSRLDEVEVSYGGGWIDDNELDFVGLNLFSREEEL